MANTSAAIINGASVDSMKSPRGSPLVVRWPGRFREGFATNSLANWIDIYSTLVDVAGGEMSPNRFGTSLVPILMGESETVQDAVFSEIGHQDVCLDYMVRTPDFKWFERGGKESLFDMKNDPYELRNLIDVEDQKARVVEIKLRLLEFLRCTQVNYSAGYRSLFTRLGFYGDDREGMAERLEEMFTELHYGDRDAVTATLRGMGMS
jgi:hypothetical protein